MEQKKEILNWENEPYLIAINVLLLFVNYSTFLVISILDEQSECTLQEIKDASIKEELKLTSNEIEIAVERLHLAKIIRFDIDKYYLNNAKIKEVNNVLNALGKYAKNIDDETNRNLLKQIREILKEMA